MRIVDSQVVGAWGRQHVIYHIQLDDGQITSLRYRQFLTLRNDLLTRHPGAIVVSLPPAIPHWFGKEFLQDRLKGLNRFLRLTAESPSLRSDLHAHFGSSEQKEELQQQEAAGIPEHEAVKKLLIDLQHEYEEMERQRSNYVQCMQRAIAAMATLLQAVEGDEGEANAFLIKYMNLLDGLTKIRGNQCAVNMQDWLTILSATEEAEARRQARWQEWQRARRLLIDAEETMVVSQLKIDFDQTMQASEALFKAKQLERSLGQEALLVSQEFQRDAEHFYRIRLEQMLEDLILYRGSCQREREEVTCHLPFNVL